MSKCTHDSNMIVWDEDKSRYECEICNTKKCKCGIILTEGEDWVLCGRCEDKETEARYELMGWM